MKINTHFINENINTTIITKTFTGPYYALILFFLLLFSSLSLRESSARVYRGGRSPPCRPGDPARTKGQRRSGAFPSPLWARATREEGRAITRSVSCLVARHERLGGIAITGGRAGRCLLKQKRRRKEASRRGGASEAAVVRTVINGPRSLAGRGARTPNAPCPWPLATAEGKSNKHATITEYDIPQQRQHP